MPYEEFEQRASEKLGQPLASALGAATEGEFDPDAFRLALGENLSSGRFRLDIAVDDISEELRDAVLYLNQQTKTDFLAVQLSYLSDSGIEILVPTVYGQELVESEIRV